MNSDEIYNYRRHLHKAKLDLEAQATRLEWQVRFMRTRIMKIDDELLKINLIIDPPDGAMVTTK